MKNWKTMGIVLLLAAFAVSSYTAPSYAVSEQRKEISNKVQSENYEIWDGDQLFDFDFPAPGDPVSEEEEEQAEEVGDESYGIWDGDHLNLGDFPL